MEQKPVYVESEDKLKQGPAIILHTFQYFLYLSPKHLSIGEEKRTERA